MSDPDELPSWASRTVQPGTVAAGNVIPPLPSPSPSPQPERRRRAWPLVALVGLVALGAVGYGGYWLANRNNDGSVATADPNPTEPSIGSDQLAADDTASTATATTATTEPPTTTAPAETTATTDTSSTAMATDSTAVTAENPAGAIRYAVLKSGVVYLRGKVPSEAVSTEIATKAGMVVGPDNVHNEYTIDPSVPRETAAPIYVEDVVLFGFNSVKVEPAFLPILDLGILLMKQNPNVKMTVVARTDAAGSAATNLEVSQQRAQAVINYWSKAGIDPSRITADARGEADASDSEDAQAAALDRRAEFIISGLLS